MMRTILFVIACVAAMASTTGQAQASVLYFNGFETNIDGWDAFGPPFDATRVPSGTNGITSASGSFHAESSVGVGSAGNWGGYNFGAGGGVPTAFQEYTTSLDIFLDVDGGWANDTRFDFSSAINNNSGNFLRDFVYNAGFYNDATGPGAGTNRFVISAGNNAGRANSFPKNTGAIAISTTGWYTFEHHFYDNAGVLNVDFNIFDSSSALVNSWTLGTDPIAGVGGNRYGWFANNELSTLAFDNTELRTAMAAVVPEPSTFALLGIGGLALVGYGVRRKRQQAA